MPPLKNDWAAVSKMQKEMDSVNLRTRRNTTAIDASPPKHNLSVGHAKGHSYSRPSFLVDESLKDSMIEESYLEAIERSRESGITGPGTHSSFFQTAVSLTPS